MVSIVTAAPSVTSSLEGGIRRAAQHIGSVTIVPGFATDEAPRAG